MPTTLLAVDDSVTMRKVLELTFAGEDFRVVTAESADAAIAKIRAERPTVVLCDVTLDAPGGYALCTKIKTDNPTIAVVMLASKQQPYDTAKGQAAKADDFVEKPFDTQQLIDKVKRLAVRPAVQESQARPGAPPAPLPGASAGGMPPARPAPGAAPMPPGAPVGGGGSRPSVPGAGAPVNPRPPAPNLSAAGGIGRGTLAYGGAGFPGMPGTPPAASAPAPAASAPAPAASAPAPAASALATATGGPSPATSAPAFSPSAPGTPGRAPLPSAPSAAQTTPGHQPSGQAPSPPPAAASARASSASQQLALEGPPASLGVGPASPASSNSGSAPPDAVARPDAPGARASAPAAWAAGPAMAAATSPLADKLAILGLTDAQVTAVLALSREVVERVVWEVVPVLAETIIKEEIARLTHDV